MKWLKCLSAMAVAFLLGICATKIMTEAPIFSIDSPERTVIEVPTTTPVPTDPSESPKQNLEITDVYVEDERLTYNGYIVEKRFRTAQVENHDVEVSYVVLTRNGRILFKFDGVYSALGNSTQFGLISLLGGPMKQIVVTQDEFRGGNQWVVTLGETPRIIYDGMMWGTGREGEDLGILDLDGDSIFEISAPVTAFYGFVDQRLSTMNTPLPTVIFKYNSRTQGYLPANHLFPEYSLGEQRGKQVTVPSNPDNHLGDVLEITLDYIFAGREEDGWAFFERECKLPDKISLRRRIQAILDMQPTYRYINRAERRVSPQKGELQKSS